MLFEGSLQVETGTIWDRQISLIGFAAPFFEPEP